MKKTLLIALSIIILTVSIFIGCSDDKVVETADAITTTSVSETTTQQAYIINEQIPIWKSICENFIYEYYTLSHTTSRYANLSKCKKYMTCDLYEKFEPSEKITETPDNLIDVDYSSRVSIKNNYYYNDTDNTYVAKCSVTTEVNNHSSINEYFIIFILKEVNNEWLIDDFKTISIQGEE